MIKKRFKINCLSKHRQLALKLGFILLYFTTSCTSVGDDDPWLSLRSRDARIKNSWKLTELQTTFDVTTTAPGQLPVRTLVSANFNGRDYFLSGRIGDSLAVDTAFGFSFKMNVKKDGALSYEFSQIFGGLGVRSEGQEQWHWVSDDRRKSSVYLGQVPLLIGTGGIPEQFLDQLGINENLLQNVSVKELRNKTLTLEHKQSYLTTRFDGAVQSVKLYYEASFEDD